jgi:hypothetical protein
MGPPLVVTASSALAQKNRGTDQLRVACTPDVLPLCSWEIPNVDRIVAGPRREKSQLSAGCRQVLEVEATASHAALNNDAGRVMPRDTTLRGIARLGVRKKRYARIARHAGLQDLRPQGPPRPDCDWPPWEDGPAVAKVSA